MIRLSERQALMLNMLQRGAQAAASDKRPEMPYLIGGREYQTAAALERRGLVSIRYQGPSLGWVSLTDAGREAPTNH